MRKIKNFKINVAVSEVVRAVNKLNNVEQASQEARENISCAVRYYLKFLKPCVIYNTFPKDSLILENEKDIPQNALAKTVFFAAIGAQLEEEFQKNKAAYGDDTEKIVSTIAVESLEQSKKFAVRLISSEADDENAVIMRPVEIAPENYEKLNSLIDIGKIGVSYNDKQLNPKHSLCGLCYWLASKKKVKK
ncbi:MAG: hypothetical protein LBV16_08735 [Elusimicrobiota bacterium]|jgi:hypothetical protein|nr:hypothetical protein [Elusimicrobiota bacterium]